MVSATLPFWPVESASLVVARSLTDDERLLDAGERYLTEAHRRRLAEDHPNQVASMMATHADGEE